METKKYFNLESMMDAEEWDLVRESLRSDTPPLITLHIDATISAARAGHMDIVLLLNEIEPVDFNWIGTIGAGSGDMNMVKTAIEMGAKDLHWMQISAARSGHKDIVLFLADKGAGKEEWTTCTAASHGYFHIVKAMVEKYNLNNYSSIALSACMGGSLDIVKWCRSKKDFSVQPIAVAAAREGYVDIVHNLLPHVTDLAAIEQASKEGGKRTVLSMIHKYMEK